MFHIFVKYNRYKRLFLSLLQPLQVIYRGKRLILLHFTTTAAVILVVLKYRTCSEFSLMQRTPCTTDKHTSVVNQRQSYIRLLIINTVDIQANCISTYQRVICQQSYQGAHAISKSNFLHDEVCGVCCCWLASTFPHPWQLGRLGACLQVDWCVGLN